MFRKALAFLGLTAVLANPVQAVETNLSSTVSLTTSSEVELTDLETTVNVAASTDTAKFVLVELEVANGSTRNQQITIRTELDDVTADTKTILVPSGTQKVQLPATESGLSLGSHTWKVFAQKNGSGLVTLTTASYLLVGGFDVILDSAVINFVDLNDTPASLTSQGTKLVRVNAGETALEFITDNKVDTAGGSTNVVAKFSDANTLANSSLTDTGTSVATTVPLYLSSSGKLIFNIPGGADVPQFVATSSFLEFHSTSGRRFTLTGDNFQGSSGAQFGWTSSGSNAAADTLLSRASVGVVGVTTGFLLNDTSQILEDADNVVGVRNSTNAQSLRLYETYTDASNYERYSLISGSDALAITAQEAGTGSDNLSISLIPIGTGTVNLGSASGITVSTAGLASFPDDVRQIFNPGSTNAGLNVGSLAGDPSSPSNGDLWYDSSAEELTARINGANVALGASGSGDITDVWTVTSGNVNALTAASGDSLDASAADSTAPVKDGTSPPGTCNVSEMFFDTDETAGLNLYGCTSSNTWTLLGDGGAGGGDSVSVNSSAATDANFIDGGGIDWALNTSASPDEITASVKAWERFSANQAFLPTANYATHFTRNTHPILQFDAATDECAYFGGVLKNSYTGNGLTVVIGWMATSATSGATGWLAAIERHDDDTTDLDADSFAADRSVSTTTSSASGEVKYSTISFTDGAQMDNLAAGESYRLRVCRDGDGSVVTDSMTGDAELYKVVVREN